MKKLLQFSGSLLALFLLLSGNLWAYSIQIEFLSEFDDDFQAPLGIWQNLNQSEVESLIVNAVTADFSPRGISVSTTSGDFTIKIGGSAYADEDKGDVFGADPHQGSFLDPAAYGQVFSHAFTRHPQWQGTTNATEERVSTAIAGTASHEAGHMLNAEHAYMWDSFDPTISGTLDANYRPLAYNDDNMPSSAKTDPDPYIHLMATGNDDYITFEQRATIDRSFSANSIQAIDFANEGGTDITTNLAWLIPYYGYTNYTFPQQQDFTISSGKTLIIGAAGYTHNINGHAIILEGTIENHGTIAPTNTTDIRLQTGSDVKILGKSIQATIDTASSGNSVLLLPGTYSESFDMASGVHLKRSGSGTVALYGTVDFNSVSGNDVQDIQFNNKVTLYGAGGIEFTNCQFYASSTYTLSATNGTPNFFTGCDFQGSTDALILNNQDPFIDECHFHGASRYGINATNGSEPDVFRDNHLYSNYTYEIRADDTCDDIYAEYNYWYPVPPNVHHDGSPDAEIITDNYQSHTKPALAGRSEEATATALRRTGRRLLREKQVEEAVKYFHEVVDTYPNSRSAQIALGHLVSAYQQLGQVQQALDDLENLARRTPNNDLAALAQFHTIPLMVALGKSAQAVERADDLSRRYPDSRCERLALFNKGFILAGQSDMKGRAEAFSALIERYPGTDEAVVAAAILDSAAPQAEKEEVAVAGGTVLSPNYPNPFNPSTTIAFTLDQPGQVDLIIYNPLGQEVRKLLSGVQMAAGAHRLVWDGRDALGRTVSSGVYLYEMRAGTIRGLNRMVLLK